MTQIARPCRQSNARRGPGGTGAWPHGPNADMKRIAGAEGGTRTHTLLRAADFESAASTDSATSAGIPRLARGAKYRACVPLGVGAHPVGDPRGWCMRCVGLSRTG